MSIYCRYSGLLWSSSILNQVWIIEQPCRLKQFNDYDGFQLFDKIGRLESTDNISFKSFNNDACVTIITNK